MAIATFCHKSPFCGRSRVHQLPHALGAAENLLSQMLQGVAHWRARDFDHALQGVSHVQDNEDRAPFDTGVFGSIKIDRRLDPLRGEPRFEALVRKVMSGAESETP